MIILCDSWEQRPYLFEKYDVQVERAGLPTGDYSIAGLEQAAAVERKSLDDLVGCLMGDNRRRFERELMRGSMLDFFAVVIEADLADVKAGRYRSAMKPHSVLQSVCAFSVRHRVSFLWTGSREAGEYMTFSLLGKYASEIERKQYETQKGGCGR